MHLYICSSINALAENMDSEEKKEIDAKISDAFNKMQKNLKGNRLMPLNGERRIIAEYSSEISALLLEKSALLTKDLTASVEKLYKSSIRLEHFTRVLIAATVFLAILGIIQLFSAGMSFWSRFGLGLVGFIIVIIVFVSEEIFEKKS